MKRGHKKCQLVAAGAQTSMRTARDSRIVGSQSCITAKCIQSGLEDGLRGGRRYFCLRCLCSRRCCFASIDSRGSREWRRGPPFLPVVARVGQHLLFAFLFLLNGNIRLLLYHVSLGNQVTREELKLLNHVKEGVDVVPNSRKLSL